MHSARIRSILAQMTPAEKLGQLQIIFRPNLDDAAALVREGIGSVFWPQSAVASNALQREAVENTRLGIPILIGLDVIHGQRTIAPVPLGQAASFDPAMVEHLARTAAREARSGGVTWTFSPMIDVSRDPRWGRVVEGFGEDVHLNAVMGAAMVRGYQGPDLAGHGTIAATAKHYVGYGQPEGGRDYNAVDVSAHRLRNVYLEPFRAAVQAGVASIMASFNTVAGVPMHMNRALLTDVLKSEWGFGGAVVGDAEGVVNLLQHRVAETLEDAVLAAYDAGLDIEMGGTPATIGLDAASLDPVRLDDAVARVLGMKEALGLFDRPYVGDPGRGNAPTAQSREVARRAAHASHVLVSNNGVLPLASHAGTVHLTGPFAEAAAELLGTWTLDGRGGDVVSPASAFRARLGEQRLLVSDGRFSDRAVQQVRNADVTVAVVGEHPWRSGEANSVTDIGLPAGQLEHLRQLARIGKPLVVVAYTGRPLELGDVMDLADAVLVVWHPGVEAGNALADIVFGDVAPHGRLPMTFPRTTGHIPTSTHQRPTGRLIELHEEGRQGRYLDDQVFPRLPFGHGLTYTSFEYGELRAVGGTALSGGAGLAVEVDVTNTGDRPGREVVQLSFRDPVAQVTRPLTELVDWSVLALQPGEKGTATFTVHPEQFSYFGRDNRLRLDAGEIVLVAGPDALHGSRLSVTVTP